MILYYSVFVGTFLITCIAEWIRCGSAVRSIDVSYTALGALVPVFNVWMTVFALGLLYRSYFPKDEA